MAGQVQRHGERRRHGIGRAAWRVGAHVLVLVGCALSFGACINDKITASRSSVSLVIERIGAAPGGTNEDPIPTLLQSDVLTNGGVFEDVARVTTRLAFKDPGTAENPSSPTSANFVTIDRFRVEYTRTDGRNTPGVDVPYPWDGAVTFTTVSGIQTAEFTLVRASAKLEPPLRGLRNLGGDTIIFNTIVTITFFGFDQTGAEVIAIGTIGINFADWADPASGC